MWCDDFDLDLLKVVPEALIAIEPVRKVLLYTLGHTSDGRLNHPAVWNGAPGFMAFFAFEPDRASILPEGYSGAEDAEIVTCSFEEVVRDCWLHHYVIILCYRLPGFARWRNALLWNSAENASDFETLLWATRHWRQIAEERVTEARRGVVLSLRHAAMALLDCHTICRRGTCPG